MVPIAGAGNWRGSPFGYVGNTYHTLGSSGERGLGERSGIVLIRATTLGRCGAGAESKNLVYQAGIGVKTHRKCQC